MSFFPNFTKDRIVADLTVALATPSIAAAELMANPTEMELLWQGIRVPLTVLAVVVLNNVEQDVITTEKHGWVWNRNERPWMKAMTTMALVALPELLTWAAKTSLETDVGPMHDAKLWALFLAIGFSMFDVLKDMLAVTIQKMGEANEAQFDAERQAEWDQMNANTGRQLVQESADEAQRRQNEATAATVQQELERRRAIEAQREEERRAEKKRKELEKVYKGRVSWVQVVRAGRQLGKSDKQIHRDIVRRAHPDVRSDVDSDVIQSINAAYDKSTDTFQI